MKDYEFDTCGEKETAEVDLHEKKLQKKNKLSHPYLKMKSN